MNFICRLLFSLSFILIIGCSAKARIDSIGNTFLEGVDPKSKIDNLPFAHAWVREDFDGRNYKKVYLKEIRTDLLPKEDWKKSINGIINSEEDYKKEADLIAKYFYTELENKIKAYPGNRIELVKEPASDALTVQIAITELEFSHPIARAGALVSPIPGTSALVGAVSDPHMAFAARIEDPHGKLAATVADRKFPPARIVDLNKLTVSSSAHEVSAIWAETMAEAMNKGRFTKTERRGGYAILPW